MHSYEELNKLTKKDLIDKCATLNITVSSSKTKVAIINMILSINSTDDIKNNTEYNKNIERCIKNNSAIFDDINQILHNEGYGMSIRYKLIKDILYSFLLGKELESSLITDDKKDIILNIKSIIDNSYLPKYELLQRFFMYYGNKYFQKTLDQYYTPISIGQFICSTILKNKKIIDPASGTGDLVITYDGSIDLWDVSEEVLELTKVNYEIHNKSISIQNIDSLSDISYESCKYHYVILNPPFGTKTIIDNKKILGQYELGKNRAKQEIGILFIERAMNLLKDDGILFAIIPSGYLGNINKNYVEFRKYIVSNYKILAIIRLPNNTFSRSGTGVSTSIMVIQKKRMNETYNIFIDDIKNIGYDLSKKNTPLRFKKDNDGNYLLDENKKPIIDNDLDVTLYKICNFASDNNIIELVKQCNNIQYEMINSTELLNSDNLIIDIGRYLKSYKDTIESLRENSSKISDLCIINPDLSYKKDKNSLYTYLDITEVNTPMYNGKKLYGHQLPQRAKYLLKRNDIIVSRLKGKISFTIIVDDSTNLIASNGFCVLRPSNTNNIPIILGNLFSSKFVIQHGSLATGSIMESISDNDIMNILIDIDIDTNKYNNIIKSLEIIHNELYEKK
jgi:tRNA1(Val) A37 N6-methylase TrmN6